MCKQNTEPERMIKMSVPYEKLSKKEKRIHNAKKRVLWSDYGVSMPSTKVVPDKKKNLSKNMCRKYRHSAV